MKKLLITGVSGFLGWNLCQIAHKRWKTYGTVFSHNIEIPNVNITKVDLTDYHAVKELFLKIGPDAVIHTAALTNLNYCQEHETRSHKINVDASVNIAGLCADNSIPCVFTSSDMVFNGQNAPYKEEDDTCPVNRYGEHKVLAEQGMTRRHAKVIICRMPLMFGTSGSGAESFIQPMIRALRTGNELRLFTDEFRTPVSSRAAVKGIFTALEKVTGIIHLGGKERISRFDFGNLLVHTIGMSNERLTPCTQNDIVMAAPRPPDVSLDSTKASSLGFNPLPLSKELEELVPYLS